MLRVFFATFFLLAQAYAITLDDHVNAGRIDGMEAALAIEYLKDPNNLPSHDIRTQCLGTCYDLSSKSFSEKKNGAY